MDKIREQIERMRKPIVLKPEGTPISKVTIDNSSIADTMEAMLEVALHAKRMLRDPSWEPHQINLGSALAKLEEQ